MVGSYVLICVVLRLSPLLIIKGFLILTPLFSNQTRASTLDHSTSHQTNPRILAFFPLLIPDTQPAKPFSVSHPQLIHSSTLGDPALSLPSLLLKVPMGHLEQHHHSSGGGCGFIVGTSHKMFVPVLSHDPSCTSSLR